MRPDRWRGTRVRRITCPRSPAPFTSDDDLLQAAIQMFRARQALVDAEQQDDVPEKRLDAVRNEEAAWRRYWHGSFRLSGTGVEIRRRCRRHRLNRTECEILVVLVLGQLSLLECQIGCCADVLDVMGLPGTRIIAALRMLSQHGKLFRVGLIAYDDPDEEISRRTPVVDPVLVDSILARDGQAEKGWPVASEGELYDRLPVLTQAMARKSDCLEMAIQDCGSATEVFRWTRKVERLLDKLEETLELHRGWQLAEFHKSCIGRIEWPMFMALLGKELGHLPVEDGLFTGGGLARAVIPSADHYRQALRLLSSRETLVADGLVRPCGGAVELAADDPRALQETEFELTGATIETLGIRKLGLRKHGGEYHARGPQVQLNQLVLPDRVARAVEMALVHTRNVRRLTDDWGIGEVVPYGRSITLLFSGPPGTGKTATAEALADALDKPILVADYSRIQNCFVGQTEKNIVRAFREAASQDAVLFWDEADAMFFDRDTAHRNWEVRDVNVLLQELERFEGVCILATNRKITLDKALQRRIAIKVEFSRPDRDQRRRIWKKLLPRKLPLARDVDLDELSTVDFTGGEIKNVVLNAARLALRCEEAGSVAMGDFRAAIAMEQAGSWNQDSRNRIGFNP